MDDCTSYCPFTLTVRAVPRSLPAGRPVTTLLGPGQWQSFRLVAGAYDLLEVTLERPGTRIGSSRPPAACGTSGSADRLR